MGDQTDGTYVEMPRRWGGLIWTLIRTDFKVRYHGTLGGFVWALLKPAMMFLVLMSVFSFIFAGEPNYRLNLIVGLFLWDFFAESTKVGLLALQSKGYLLTKTRFPHWIIIAVSSSNAFITLGAFLSIVLVTLIGIGQTPSLIAALLFCSYILCFWGIILGINLAGSVLCVRYRDLNQVWEVATQAGFFIAPVVYPLGILPERFHFYLYLWPPTAVIQFSRMALIEGTLPTSNGHLLLAGMSLTIFAAGVLVYRLFDRTIIEEL